MGMRGVVLERAVEVDILRERMALFMNKLTFYRYQKEKKTEGRGSSQKLEKTGVPDR